MFDNTSYEVGIQLGQKSYTKNKLFYKEIYNTLETEDDAIEVMLNCWLAEELIINLVCADLDNESVRKGWSKGFLDCLFPLRKFC